MPTKSYRALTGVVNPRSGEYRLCQTRCEFIHVGSSKRTLFLTVWRNLYSPLLHRELHFNTHIFSAPWREQLIVLNSYRVIKRAENLAACWNTTLLALAALNLAKKSSFTACKLRFFRQIFLARASPPTYFNKLLDQLYSLLAARR